MIGRDEDGVQINSNYTYYLGEQSREVVLGALQESYALVTMSESESFGIVIVEAWMLQKPVIINEKCPAFIELVEDGINGLHTNKDNLENTLSHLLNNVNQACELGKNGNTLVDKYRWNIIGEKINNSLLMLLNTNHELIHIRDKTS
jgi:glycosyltransferase involved in cell wall biosynthesis